MWHILLLCLELIEKLPRSNLKIEQQCVKRGQNPKPNNYLDLTIGACFENPPHPQKDALSIQMRGVAPRVRTLTTGHSNESRNLPSSARGNHRVFRNHDMSYILSQKYLVSLPCTTETRNYCQAVNLGGMG